jgi:phosphohistidine phosphatase
MILYFLRHGLAMDRAEWHDDDSLRPLTARGMKNMLREADTMRALDLSLDAIITSPLVRAYQTADIVAKRLNLKDDLVQDERLGVGFGYPELIEILNDHAGANQIMLVGHEPGLSQAIGALIGNGSVLCKKGSLARVDITGRDPLQGVLVYLLPPKILIG